jgi:mono/diheme cytochrome c family protein
LIGEEALAAFQRGAQRVELIGNDRASGQLNFYLLDFEQACNHSERGCTPGDLYTPRIEQDWSDVRIRDDEDLENTPSDCRQCHQRGQAQAKLLMRELNSPWTHFFFPSGFDEHHPGVGGSDLRSDYVAAKGDERYADVSMEALDPSAVFRLQLLAGQPQPLLFDAPAIMSERYPSGIEGELGPAASATWEAAYEAFKRGEQLALPYVESRVADLEKQTALAAAYQRFRAGELSADQLPDLADVFPDDPSTRARIGLQTDAATPQEALIQACASCHNDVLDQSLSRARFNVDLSRLDRNELESAIERIERDPNAVGAMPPPEARALDPNARALLLEYLRDPATGTQPDPALRHAAEQGMAGGAGP